MAWGVLLSSALAVAQSSSPGSAQFLNEVTVNADRVRFADLLAPGAARQQRAIGGIDLGRAPEPGSWRVFTAAELRAAVGGGLAFEVPAQIIVHRTGWPVTSQRIVAALAAAELPASSVDILGAPVTRTPDAELEVSAAHPARGAETLLVRFACRVRSDCNPFWGEIRGVNPIAVSEKPGHNPLTPIRHAVPLVTPAHPALLVCDEPGIKIRLRVRPLKAAGLGERVKVMDPETRRIFFARVKAEDLVESGLEEAR